MQSAALMWFLFDRTGDPRWPSWILVAQVGPTVLLGAWGGSLADRYPRRRVVFWTQSAFLCHALLLAALTACHWTWPSLILLLMLLSGVIQAVDLPARLAFVPELVPREDLINAVGLNALLFNSARAIGPALAALIFLISAIAELGRAPFDLAEAESEIVAGFHIEYTGMKFGLFYAGELLHAVTMGALFATFFLGGWRGPFVEQAPILGVVYLLLKAMFLYWVIMWVKYSLPRVRIDHMLAFNWKLLTPLALALVIATAVLDKILVGMGVAPGSLVYTLWMLALNILIGWVTVSLLRTYARLERQRVGEPKPIARPELSGVKPLRAPEA